VIDYIYLFGGGVSLDMEELQKWTSMYKDDRCEERGRMCMKASYILVEVIKDGHAWLAICLKT